MVLVDTSVWAEVFRRPCRLRLEDHVDFDDVVTCLPVVQEVLQGFEDESAYRVAREAMLALPAVEVPLGADAYLEAAELQRAARRLGLRVRSDVDCLIAVCAIRHRLDVLHRGRDFELLARIAPFRARAVRR